MIYIGIFGVFFSIIVFIMGILLGLKCSSPETVSMRQLSIKRMDLFKLAVKWIKNPEKITNYIRAQGYKRVGVYGMSYLGDCLVETLQKEGIEVIYGIDRNAEKIYNSYVPIYHIEDELPDIDVLIVTAFVSYQQIKKEMEQKMDKNTEIVCLENILYR